MRTLTAVCASLATGASATAQLCPTSLVNGDFSVPIPNGEVGNGWRFDGRCDSGWATDAGHLGGGIWLNECGQLDSDPCVTTTIGQLCPQGAYLLQAEFRSSGYPSSDLSPFVIEVDGQPLFTANTWPSGEWRSASVLFRPSTSDASVRICAEANGSDSDFYLDNVRVVPTAVITQQPVSVQAAPGTPVTFVVLIEAPPGCEATTSYQWERRAPAELGGQWAALSENARFINTRGPALVINNPGPAVATGYRCRITPGCGPELLTAEVNFDIACPSDFNADGSVDGDDVIEFFERWDAGC
jgi:hypothetical protein